MVRLVKLLKTQAKKVESFSLDLLTNQFFYKGKGLIRPIS